MPYVRWSFDKKPIIDEFIMGTRLIGRGVGIIFVSGYEIQHLRYARDDHQYNVSRS